MTLVCVVAGKLVVQAMGLGTSQVGSVSTRLLAWVEGQRGVSCVVQRGQLEAPVVSTQGQRMGKQCKSSNSPLVDQSGEVEQCLCRVKLVGAAA